MKKQRLLVTLLILVLSFTSIFALSGCSKKTETSETGGSASTEGETKTEDAAKDSAEGKKDVVVMVPSADHGWTGAVLTYAQEKVDELNADAAVSEKYTLRVLAAADVEDQIRQVDDLLSNVNTLAGVVILPYDNGLQSTLEKLAAAEIPFVQFDRVIESGAIDANVVANVKGDNEGIGYETAKRFIADGLSKEDYVYEMIGDNSSVPELRSNGFRKYLKEEGWSDEEINKVVVKSAATGWSRDTGKELFESWFGSAQCDTSKNIWIFTHDDEIAMGILESLNGSALDENKKVEFMQALKSLSSSSGLAEMYAVLKDKHQTITAPTTYDIFSVTYDPGMIQTAVQVMMDSLSGNSNIDQNYIIPVSVVDGTNVGDYQAFGSYTEK